MLDESNRKQQQKQINPGNSSSLKLDSLQVPQNAGYNPQFIYPIHRVPNFSLFVVILWTGTRTELTDTQLGVPLKEHDDGIVFVFHLCSVRVFPFLFCLLGRFGLSSLGLVGRLVIVVFCMIVSAEKLYCC